MSVLRFALPAVALLLAVQGAVPQEPAFRFQHDGYGYDVRPAGTLGRRSREDSVSKAGSSERGRVWKIRFFIFRKLEYVWASEGGLPQRVQKALSAAEIRAVGLACKNFADLVQGYTGRRVMFDAEIQEIDVPLKELSGEGDGRCAFSDVTDELIGKRVPAGTDSVIVLWPCGSLRLGGRTSDDLYKGAGYSSVALADPIDEGAVGKTLLHEWLRQVDRARLRRSEYAGLPGPDDGGTLGYRPEELADYYRDLLSVYIAPDMWATLDVRAAGNAAPSFKGGFVRDWLVAGPFPNEGCGGFMKDFVGEERVVPRRGEAAGNRVWTPTRSTEDQVDLARVFKESSNVVSYAHVYTFSGDRRPVRLWLGSDDGVRVFFNGHAVWTQHTHRGCDVDEESVDVTLKPGWNRILMKVDQGNGDWKLVLRVANLDGSAVAGLRFQADRPASGVVLQDELPDAPARFRWADVWRDPWRRLPALTEAHLRKWTGDAGLAVAGGPNFVALRPLGGVESPLGRGEESKDTELNNVLNFDAEGLAWLRTRSDWLLVRPDLMPLLAARAVARHGEASEGLELGDCLVGRLTVQNRPVFVLETRLGDPPGCEVDLVGHRDGGLLGDLRFDPPSACAGDRVKVRLLLGAKGAAGRKFLLNGTDAQEAASGARSIEWEREIPSDAPLGWVRYAATGDGFSEVGAVRIVDPMTIKFSGLEAPQSWTGAPVTLEVRNNRAAPMKVRLDGRAAFNPAWPAEFELAPRTARTLEGKLEQMDVAFTLTGSWGADQRTWSVRRNHTRLPWRLAGPFGNAEGRGFDTEYGPERNSDPDQIYGGVRWKDIVDADVGSLARVDFGEAFDTGEWVCAYATIDFEMGADAPARLHFGSDDTLTVWLDGGKIVAQNVARRMAPDQDVKDVTLKKGRHRLLVKVCNGTGAWGFLFGATAPDGKALDGLRYLPPGK